MSKNGCKICVVANDANDSDGNVINVEYFCYIACEVTAAINGFSAIFYCS